MSPDPNQTFSLFVAAFLGVSIPGNQYPASELSCI